jgi:hypothetical protein
MWKAKIPLKIKIWLWLIWHNAIARRITCLEEAGVVTQNASFVMKMRAFCISFSLALLQNLFGAVWPDR